MSDFKELLDKQTKQSDYNKFKELIDSRINEPTKINTNRYAPKIESNRTDYFNPETGTNAQKFAQRTYIDQQTRKQSSIPEAFMNPETGTNAQKFAQRAYVDQQARNRQDDSSKKLLPYAMKYGSDSFEQLGSDIEQVKNDASTANRELSGLISRRPWEKYSPEDFAEKANQSEKANNKDMAVKYLEQLRYNKGNVSELSELSKKNKSAAEKYAYDYVTSNADTGEIGRFIASVNLTDPEFADKLIDYAAKSTKPIKDAFGNDLNTYETRSRYLSETSGKTKSSLYYKDDSSTGQEATNRYNEYKKLKESAADAQSALAAKQNREKYGYNDKEAQEYEYLIASGQSAPYGANSANNNIFDAVNSAINTNLYKNGRFASSPDALIDNGERSDLVNSASTMSADERRMYNYIVKTSGVDKAAEYFNELLPELKKRGRAKRNEDISEWASGMTSGNGWLGNIGGGVLTTLASTGANLLSGPEYISNLAEGITSGEMPYSTWSDTASALRSGVIQNIDSDTWKFVYETAASAIDSVAAGLIGAGVASGLGLAGEAAATVRGVVGGTTIGLSAASSAANDIKERGGNNAQVVFGSVAAGVFETLFEEMSISRMSMFDIKNITKTDILSMVRQIVTEAGVNASEELNTELANIIYDTIANGDVSQYNLLREKYISDGMSYDEASRRVAADFGYQVLDAVKGGALMGAGFGAVGVLGARANSRVTGEITKHAFSKSGKTLGDIIDSFNYITDTGRNEETRQYAATLSARLAKGKKVTTRQIGDLVRTARKEGATAVTTDENRYTDTDVSEPTDVMDNLQILESIAADDNGKEYSADDIITEPVADTSADTSDTAPAVRNSKFDASDYVNAPDMTSEEIISESEKAGNIINSSGTAYTVPAVDSNTSAVNATLNDEYNTPVTLGKVVRGDDGLMMIEVTDSDGQKREILPRDITVSDDSRNWFEVYLYAVNSNNDKFANLLVSDYDGISPGSAYAHDVIKAFESGHSQTDVKTFDDYYNSLSNVSAPKSALLDAYNLGISVHNANLAARRRNTNTAYEAEALPNVTNESETAYIPDDDIDDIPFYLDENEEIEPELERIIKTVSGKFTDKSGKITSPDVKEVFGSLAKNLGVDIDFTNDTAFLGKYDIDKAVQRITVSLAKGNPAGTAMHEFVHMIKAVSPQDYILISGYATKYLESETGKKISVIKKEITDQYKSRGVQLSDSEALEEATCKAMEAITADNEFETKFAEFITGSGFNESGFSEEESAQKISAFKKVFEAIKKVIAKVMTFIKDETGSQEFNNEYAEAISKNAAATGKLLDTLIGSLDNIAKLNKEGKLYQVIESKSANEKYSAQEDYAEYNKPITPDDINDLRQIIKRHDEKYISVNDFTSEDIKKSQKWAYKFDKELGIKSPFFRAGVGDWRAYDTSTIKIVDVPTIDISEVDLKHGNYQIKDTGWTVYVGKTLKDDTTHYSGGERVNVKSLNVLSEILQNSVLLDTIVSENNSRKKAKNTAFLHKLYAPIYFKQKLYLAVCTVEEYYSEATNGVDRRAYNLKAIKIESAGGRLENKVSGSPKSDADSNISISDLYQIVKRYDKKFHPGKEINPYLLNADGTPKVFYHGTDSDFDAFDVNEISSREGSFFFAENREDAEAYGNNVLEVYLTGNNLADYDNQPSEFYRLKSKREQVEYLKRRGYDGWYADMDSGGWGEVSVFNPEQIKSATDNIGTFDINNKNIKYSLPDDKAVIEKQNKKIEFQKKQIEYLKKMRFNSQGKVYSEAGENRLLRRILKDTGSKYKFADFKQEMTNLYSLLESGRIEESVEMAQAIADRVLSDVQNIDTTLYDEYKDFRATLRKGVYLNESQKAEIEHRYNSLSNFKKLYRGKIRFTDKLGDGLEAYTIWENFRDQLDLIIGREVRADAEMPVLFGEILDATQKKITYPNVEMLEAPGGRLEYDGMVYKLGNELIRSYNDNGRFTQTAKSAERQGEQKIIGELDGLIKTGYAAPGTSPTISQIYDRISSSEERAKKAEEKTDLYKKALRDRGSHVVDYDGTKISIQNLIDKYSTGVIELSKKDVKSLVDEAYERFQKVANNKITSLGEFVDIMDDLTAQLSAYRENSENINTNISETQRERYYNDAVADLWNAYIGTSELQTVKGAYEQGVRLGYVKSVVNYRNKREATELRNQIKRLYTQAANRINKPTRARYLPAGNIRELYFDMLKLINISSGNLGPATKDKFVKLQQALDYYINNHYRDIRPGEEDKFINRYTGDALDAAKSALDYAIERFSEIAERNGNGEINIYDLGKDDLRVIYNALRAVDGVIVNATQAFTNGRRWEINDLSYNIGAEIAEARDPYKRGIKRMFRNLADSGASEFLAPMRLVGALTGYKENSLLEKLMHGFEAGYINESNYIMESRKMFDGLTGSKEYNRFRYNTFTPKYSDGRAVFTDARTGEEIKMTKAIANYLIMAYEREMSNPDLVHMEKGGVFLQKPEAYKKNGSKGYLRRNLYFTGPVTSFQIDALRKYCNTDYDIAWRKTAREYFDKNSAKAINYVYVNLYGYDFRASRDYIPLRVVKDYLVNDNPDSVLKFDKSLMNIGILHSLEKKSPLPIMAAGIDEVVNDNIGDVSKIYGYALPVDTFNKVWNASSGYGGMNVKSLIENAYTRKVAEVLQNVAVDAEGGRTKPDRSILDQARGAYINAVFGLNVLLPFKQLASYRTAAPYLSLASRKVGIVYLIQAIKNGAEIDAEADELTPLLYMARIGLSSAELAEAENYLLEAIADNRLTQALDKISSRGGNWIQRMDVITRRALLLATKSEIAHTTKYAPVTAEYNNALRDLYNKVLNETQSNYAFMYRPEISKSTSWAARTFSLFKNDAFQGYGLVVENFGRYMAAERLLGEAKNANRKSVRNESTEAKYKEAKKKANAAFGRFIRSVLGVLGSSVHVSSVTILAAFIFGKRKKIYQDPETGELDMASIAYRMAQMVTSEFISTMFPILGGIVGVQDLVMSNFDKNVYYDGIDGDIGLTAVMDILDAVSQVLKDIDKVSEESDPEVRKSLGIKNFYNHTLPAIRKILMMAGVPADNIHTYLNAVNEIINSFKSGDALEYYFAQTGVELTTQQKYNQLFAAYMAGDTEKVEEATSALHDGLASERMTFPFWHNKDMQPKTKTYDEIDNKMSTMLSEADDIYKAAQYRDESDYEAYEAIVKKYTDLGFKNDVVISAVNKAANNEADEAQEETNPEPEENVDNTELLYKYSDVNNAIQNYLDDAGFDPNKIGEIYQYFIDNGKADVAIHQQITKYIKPIYYDSDSATQGEIRNILITYCNYPYNFKFDKWIKEEKKKREGKE